MLTPVRLGSLIGGFFGLVFVLVNTGSLPAGAAAALRVLSAVAFVAVVAAVVLGSRRDGAAGPTSGRSFGRGYWSVVAVEVVAIGIGVNVLSGPLERPEAGVGWVSLVVGVHFFGLAAVWSQPLFHLLGAVLSLCGAASLVLAFVGADTSVVDVAGGVLPGMALLAFGLWSSIRGAAPAPAAQP